MIRPIGRQHCVLLFGSYFYKSNQIKNKFKLPTYKKWVLTNSQHHLMMDNLLNYNLTFGIKDLKEKDSKVEQTQSQKQYQSQKSTFYQFLERQKQKKQQQQKQRKRKQLNSYIGIIVACFAAFYCGKKLALSLVLQNDQVKLLANRRKAKKKYKQKIFKIPLNYVNNEVKQQISQILTRHQNEEDMKKRYLKLVFQVLVGLPGEGKSTAAKKIVEEYRQQGKEAYYVDLKIKQSGDNREQESLRILMSEVKSLIAAIKSPKNKQENPIIIIDNINTLQRTNNFYDQIIDFEKTLYAARQRGIKLIAISSSSLYIDKFRENHDVKETLVNILQPISQKNRRSIFESMLSKQENEESINYMIDNGYSPRKAQLMLQCWETHKKKVNLLQFLKQKDQQLILRYTQIIQDGFNDYATKQCIKQLIFIIKQVFNSNGVISQDGLGKIINKLKIQKEFKGTINLIITKQMRPIFNELNRKNILLFAQPRSVTEKKAFQNYLEYLTEKSKLIG